MIRLLVSLALFLPLPATAAGWVGAYLWGGVIGAPSLNAFHNTVRVVLAQGYDTIRITTGPDAIDGFPLGPSCTGQDNLACYTRLLTASSAWDDPALKRVMLTSVDRKCQSLAPANGGCFDPALLAANKAAIKAEYTAMFTALRDRFADRPIQFILSNWEGDNGIYCGNAYGFSLNAGGNTAANCMATWPSGQTRVQRVQAHLLWHSYRDEAVAEFRAANPSFGLIHAPEILIYSLFNAGCGGNCNPATDTVFKQIAASGGRQYCSWSSYDTQAPPAGPYIAAVQDILTVCENLIIGEAGWDLLKFPDPAKSVDLFAALDQIRNLPGVLGVIPWNAANPNTYAQQMGMFDAAGRSQLQHYLGPLRPAPRAPDFWR